MPNPTAQPYRGNILIADDGPDSLRLLASILTGQGYEVSKAITVNQLLRTLKSELPDLILLKTNFFGINGFDLCQMFKADEYTKHIPIIFVSHADLEEDSVRAFEVGGVDYITKPFRVREVLARIQNQLKILKLQRDLQESNAKLQSDIIERQQIEQRTRALIDAIPDIMFRHRIDGTYLDVKAREGVLLVPREQLIGKKLQDVNIPNGTKQGLLQCIRLAIEKNEIQIYEHKLQKSDGLHFYEARIVKSGADESVCMVRDVTESKLAAEALQQAKEKAEAANKAKSQFLANMSHELRTPLNAILGFTQLVAQDSSLHPEHQEHLGIISRSGKRLLQLINDVLEMAKVESGKLTLNENSFNLDLLLDTLAEIWQFRADAKGISLIFARGIIPHYIHADEGKLRQVLLNLLGNAIKFTQSGSVSLRTRIACELEPSNQNKDAKPAAAPNSISFSMPCLLHFEVEDTGYGIASEELKNLFEPFVQTEAGRRSQEGTGLGLAISQNFVRLMGGEISVSSTLGKGTIFNFYIPVLPIDLSITHPSSSSLLFRELLPSHPPISTQALHAAIAAMPYEWVVALHHAALLADANATIALIDCIDESDEQLALTLRAMVHEFRFDAIFELAQPLAVNSPDQVT